MTERPPRTRRSQRRRKIRRRRVLARDGRALYVVNYESGTVTKLRTSDMKPLQTIDACYHPIGITYDRLTSRVRVACYTSTIRVYDDR